MKKDADDNDVSKSKAEYTQAYLKAISKKFQKWINYVVLSREPSSIGFLFMYQLNRYVTSWLSLKKETSQVKETKINILMHQYEMFKMNLNENISEMFTNFTLIIYTLNSLGKTFSNAEKSKKNPKLCFSFKCGLEVKIFIHCSWMIFLESLLQKKLINWLTNFNKHQTIRKFLMKLQLFGVSRNFCLNPDYI